MKHGAPSPWQELPADLRQAAVEAHLAGRLAALLGQPALRPDPERPLTAYGVDSLLAVEIQGDVESTLGVAVDLADLLQGMSLRQLAAAVLAAPAAPLTPAAAGGAAGAAGSADDDLVPLPGGAAAAATPLSFGQRGLWFLQQLQPSSTAYNIAAAVRIAEPLDTGALRRACDLLVERHEALRFRFLQADEAVVQEAVAGRRAALTAEDAAGWSAELLAARLAAVAGQPFDLEHDPLLRIARFDTGTRGAVVALVVHHIVADLWSLAVLVRDLGVLYSRLVAGDDAALPAPALRYSDYVEWQRRRLAGERGEELWRYWREALDGAPPLLDLPVDHPRPPAQTFHGGARRRWLSPDLAQRLHALAQAHGVTLYAALLTVLATLLHRTARQRDLLLGSPTAGRGPAALADLVGYFVNPVVLRVAAAGELSFASTLARVWQTALGAFRHQDYPFPLLVERLGVARDPSRSPLFQVMLTLQRSPLGELGELGAFALGDGEARLDAGGLALQSVELPHHAAQVDLELLAAETGRGLGLTLIYATDLFEAATVDRLLGHFAVLAAGAVADPACRLDALPLLTGGEQEQLARWNDTRVALPLQRTFAELFAEQAVDAPAAVAAWCGDAALSYGALAGAARRLANELLAGGLRPEEPVAVWAPRDLDLLVAVVAILQAGGAYLPLDPRQPARRLARLVQQSGAPRVLVAGSLRQACAAALEAAATADGAAAEPPILVDLGRPDRLDRLDRLDGHGESAAHPAAAAQSVVLPSPGQLAYVLYTSGSTGAPKGAMIEHRGMLNHLLVKVRDLALGSGDRVAQTAAATFDISVWQLLSALLVGGTVEIVPDEIAGDPLRLIAAVERQGITILETVPSLLRVLLQAIDLGGGTPPALATLRWLIPTGEALPPDLCREWCGRFPAVPLLNAYGPTECSDDVTHQPLFIAPPAGAATVPIGHPVANLRLHVVDDHLGLLPVGATGELCVAGAGLGRGYLGDPARTAAVFAPDPFAAAPGERLYRTGDLGRRRADGALEFIGRRDAQVKVRGFRIELGEIEAALAEHPRVVESAVGVQRDANGEDRLVAYWRSPAGVPAGAGELRDFLRQRLPDAMIPAAFVELAILPLTPNGKLDRRALPAPDWSAMALMAARAAGATGAVGDVPAPADGIEELVAGIVSAVLGHPRIGAGEDFFAAGGHSLLATQVLARIRRHFAIDIPLADFFAAPTVAGLAARLRAAAGGEPAAPAPSPLPRGGRLPLSFGQQRLWFLQRLEPLSAAYDMPGLVHLRGALDLPALAGALRHVVQRHETLRTAFTEVGGEPYAVVLADPAVRLPVVDLDALPPDRRQRCAAALVAAEARRPFDLAHWPLFRATLLRLAASEHQLLCNLHHVISDGWSQAILVRELSHFYNQLAAAAPEAMRELAALPPLPVQYVDYAGWQLAQLAGDALENQLAFWRAELQGRLAPLDLPADRPRPARLSHRGARRTLELRPEVAAGLKSLSRAQGATLFMMLLAPFQALLARLAGQQRLNVGTPIANRRWAEVENLIGFFVNTLVLPADLHGSPSFADLVAQVRRRALGAYAHQDVSFERLVDELQPVRDLGRTPLFQVLFVLQNAPAGRLQMTGLDAAVVEVDNGTAKFDLALSWEEIDDRLSGWIEYRTDLFDGATVERWAAQLAALTETALAAPDRPLAELPLLSAAERQALLEWNDSAVRFADADTRLHQLILVQARRRPDAVAVSYRQQHLTYAELAGRAGRLAERLRALGVGAETRVAISLERSLELMVGLVGILAAEAAWVPLDPSYPPQRLAYMAESAAARVLVTHGSLLAGPLGEVQQALDLVPVCVGQEAAGAAPPAAAAPPWPPGWAAAAADTLAYVIYTSGSTGRPKGAMNSHRAIVNRLLWMQAAFGLGDGDRVLQKTPISFDVSVWELCWPLLAGAQLVMARPGGHQDNAYLVELIVAEEITTLHFVPAMLSLWLEQPGVASCGSLRRVFASGEALLPEHALHFAARLPAAALHNLYGPTEAAVDVSWWPCGRQPRRHAVPIGRPVANVALHVVDAGLAPVPCGVAGELLLGGVQVGRGYLGRPELTAERFVPDPFGGAPGLRLYRTGDLARHLPGGEVEFLGRIDFQVKLRGLRIELGEIEAAMRDHAGVRDAVATVQAVTPEDRRIVGYVVPHAWQPDRVALAEVEAWQARLLAELRRHLADRLPAYMVPAAFLLLPSLPLNPSGKLDRAALPAAQWAAGQGTLVAPRNAAEALLAEVVAALLQVERVGVEDDFFTLGGHSLLAMRLVARIRDAFGVEVPVAEIFARPTVAGMALAVAGAQASTLPPIERLPRGAAMPQSYTQARQWFLYRLAPQSVAYNIPMLVHFAGGLAVPALASTLAAIVRRHEVLRTVYATVDGEPVQQVQEQAGVPRLPLVDLAALAPDRRRQETERLAQAEARRPFDLERGPVLRTALLRHASADHVLLATVHHIAADGWSVGVMVREIEILYQALSAAPAAGGAPAAPPLAELAVQFADYASWQRRWLLASGLLGSQVAYWREQLRGAPPLLTLATDRPRPEVRTYAGRHLAFALSQQDTAALRSLGRGQGATLYMVLLAALQVLLYRHSGQTDIVVGSPIANRRSAELEALIGFFANTVTLRGLLDGSRRFSDLLAQARQATLGAFLHQDLPFEKLVEELQPVRSLSRSPIYQVLFTLQNTPYRKLRYAIPGLAVTMLESEDQGSQLDLTFAWEEDEGTLLGSIYYSTELFDAATVEQLGRQYQVLLAAILAAPDQALDQLPGFAAVERQAVAAAAPPAVERQRVRALRQAGLLPTAAELRQMLLAELPAYMVPEAFVFIDHLPLTESGKRNLPALPAPDDEDLAAEIVAPRTAMEELLAGIVAALLKRRQVGVTGNFFDMGGHSLLVMQLVARVHEALGIEITVQQVFEAPTVAALAPLVAAAGQGGAAAGPDAAPELRRLPAAQAAPLSFSQERMWFLHRLHPGESTYSIPVALRLAGTLDGAALAAAIDLVVRRHAVLRARFADTPQGPMQSVEPFRRQPLPRVDLAALPEALRPAVARRLYEGEARRPFDLGEGGLLRRLLLRVGAGEHVLFLNLHHIVTDGWSNELLARELIEGYAALHRGTPPDLPELTVQYGDFAAWQRGWLQGEALERKLDYWRSQLAAAPPQLELPLDRPRRAVRRGAGATLPVRLPVELARAVGMAARAGGVTLFMTLLAGLVVLLERYSGQACMVVGSPVAGRVRRELEDLIGLFVNTLALRVDAAADPTVAELLGRVRQVALAAYAHEDVPFEKLVAELAPARDLGMTPIFQVVLALQNAPAATLAAPGLAVTHLSLDTGTAKFDLTWNLFQSGDEVTGVVEFSTDLFDGATVDRMLAHWQTLLAEIAAAPGRRISDLALLSAGERRQLAAPPDRLWRRVARRGLHQLFGEWAARQPEAVAVRCAGEDLTYGELDRLSRQLARRLRRLGIGRETLVGLLLERSADLVVGMLAVLKAGGAYLPLDPAYPQERIRLLVADSELAVLITRQPAAGPLAATLAAGGAVNLALGMVGAHAAHAGEAAAEAVDEPLPTAADEYFGDRLAYVIYTSGSTGTPKGCMVTHGNVRRLLDQTQGWFAFDSTDSWTLFHSFAFDFSVWELWGALLTGGRLVIVPYWVSRNGPEFRDLLQRERITVLNQTPSAFRQLVEADAAAGPQCELALRSVIFGGEALDLELLAPWFARHGDERPRLVNMYGITETTVHVTYRPLGRSDLAAAGRSPIGVPIPDLGLYLLDRHGNPVVCGAVGEIHVGGAGVSRGYLGRSELTAERFVPDPFASAADPAGAGGARMYRAGDLARRRPDGDIEYLGRIDAQVKIRGFRIEPAEIEAALCRHPEVRQALVLPWRQAGGAVSLVAYLLVTASFDEPAAALRRALEAWLPEHMIPAFYVPLTELPLTANGKVDRRRLPEPDRGRPDPRRQFVAPRTAVERTLAEAWQEILGVARVGIEDNFFELGGDSILSLRVSELARRRGLAFSLQRLFQYPTIAGLAASLVDGPSDEAAAAADARPPVPFALLPAAAAATLPADVEDAYPATRLQLGMLFHGAQQTAAPRYHNVTSVRLRGALDPARLRCALDKLARRHAVLRTSFDLTAASGALQRVHRAARIPLHVVDLGGLDSAAQEAAIARWLAVEKRWYFDWTRPPLLRLTLHRRGIDDQQLSWTDHHAILDGWSIATMMADLFALYRWQGALAAQSTQPGGEPPPPAAAAFRDAVALEAAALQDGAQRRAWEEMIDRVEPLELGRWPLPNAARDPRRRPLRLPVPAAVGERLRRVAATAQVPWKTVLLAAHVRVGSLLLGSSDVVTGLVVHTRPEVAGADRALGLFLNTVPLRLRLAGGSWTQLVRTVYARELQVMALRHFPLAEIQQLAGGALRLDTAFNYRHFHVLGEIERAAGLQIEAGEDFAQNNFLLTADFEQQVGERQVVLELQFDAALLDAAQVLVIGGLYQRALAAMAEAPEARFDAFCLLDAAAAQQVLVEWNDTAACPAPALFAHQQVAAQALRTPGAAAVACGTETLTHAELEERVGRLAARLRARGVGPDTRVGLFLPRSPRLVVAVLAVLRAGGAYLPLDLQQPAERLAAIVRQAAPALLLTDTAGLPGLPASATRVLLCDEGDGAAAGWLPAADSGVAAENLAYVLFTSGSTGEPKGVMVTHGGLRNYLEWARGAYGVEPGDRVPVHSPLGFDLTVTSLLLPLAAGGCVQLVAEGRGVEALARLLAEGVDCGLLKLTPAHLVLLAHDLAGRGRRVHVESLVVGGEALTWKSIAAWRRVAPDARFYNEYGPTETVVGCCVQAVGPDQAGDGASVPIGRPIANSALYLLDDFGVPVAPGCTGEIWIGGDGVARGYLGQPELTAESFRPDPFAAVAGARLYRSGDQARALPDGRFDFLGRRDAQVKVRGVRIELGEIEAALVAVPAIDQAAALVVQDAAGWSEIAALVVTRLGAAQPPPAALRRELRGRLAEAMVPSHFVFLDALPVTHHGKLDRRAMLARFHDAAAQAAAGGAGAMAEAGAIGVIGDGGAGGELAAALAGIFRQVLRVSVAAGDDLYDLGITSFAALRLTALIEQATGRRLPIVRLLQAGTVCDLARELGAAADAPPPGGQRHLVQLAGAGERVPLFLVHPTGGSALVYRDLARHLGGRPVFGLQSQDAGVAGGAASLPEMAAAYVAEVRRLRPAGPYLLAGWSLGGMIAWEMACQLEAAGELPAVVAMLDTGLVPAACVRPAGEPRPALVEFAVDLARGEVPADWQRGDLAALPLDDQLAALWSHGRAAGLLPAELSQEQLRRQFELFASHLAAAGDYRPRPYGGRVTFIRAQQSTLDPADPTAGWQQLARGGIELCVLPGSHHALLAPPRVYQLGDLLRLRLEQADPVSSGQVEMLAPARES